MSGWSCVQEMEQNKLNESYYRLTSGHKYFRKFQKDDDEEIIANHAEYSYEYAIYLQNLYESVTRFEIGERVIFSDNTYALLYVRDILKLPIENVYYIQKIKWVPEKLEPIFNSLYL